MTEKSAEAAVATQYLQTATIVDLCGTETWHAGWAGMRFITTLFASTAVCAALLTIGGLLAAVTPDNHRREGLSAQTILSKNSPASASGDKRQSSDPSLTQ
jgi:hypothetical protein